MRDWFGAVAGTLGEMMKVGTAAHLGETMKNTAKSALERTTTTAAIAVGHHVADGTDGEHVQTGSTIRRRFKEVWLVEDRREGKSMWTRVGTAFENNDGSWNIRLSALPMAGGRLNMRDPLVRTEDRDPSGDPGHDLVSNHHKGAELRKVAA